MVGREINKVESSTRRASDGKVRKIGKPNDGKMTECSILRGINSIFTYINEVGAEREEETRALETSESSRGGLIGIRVVESESE